MSFKDTLRNAQDIAAEAKSNKITTAGVLIKLNTAIEDYFFYEANGRIFMESTSYQAKRIEVCKA